MRLLPWLLTGLLMSGGLAAEEVCKPAGKAIGVGAPGQSAYAAMARQALGTYSAQLPADVGNRLIGAVSRAPGATAGGDLSVMLMAKGSGAAAVVAAAVGAGRAQNDALVANNLGVALRGMGDYARAAVALGHARALAPGNPLVETNLGWLAMSQGDTDAAKGFFKAAVSGFSAMAPALAGLGLIEQCGGRGAAALPLFRASIKAGYSALAAAGVRSAVADMRAAGTWTADSAGAPDVYGPKADVGAIDTYWPRPPMPVTAVEVAGMMRAGRNNGIGAWASTMEAKGAAVARSLGASTGQGRASDEKALFVLSDLQSIFDARVGPVLERFANQAQPLLEDANFGFGEAERVYGCPARGKATSLHQRFHTMAVSNWDAMMREMGDLFGFSQSWLQQLSGARAAGEISSLELFTLAGVNAFGATLLNWDQAIETLWQPDDKRCDPPPPRPIRPGTLKPYKIDPTACKTGEVHMNFAIASFNADCEKMTLEFGEGVLVSGEYKFGQDWKDDTLTIFAGAGLSESLGPASAGLRTGAFISIQGIATGGTVVDYGNQSGAGLGVTAGPVSGGVDATVRLGGVSGLDVSVDASAKIAAPSAD